MLSSDSHICREYVNQALVIIPDADAWQALLRDPILDSIGISLLDMIQNELLFVAQHEEFALGLADPHSSGKREVWLPCLLLRIMEKWQRVHLEALTCDRCGWKGRTANPMVMDLYIGVPDRWRALNEAAKLPTLPCPSCQAKLP